MSALTDLFTSLANKVRSKLGTTGTYTPAQAVAAIDTVYANGQKNPKFVDVTSTNVTYGSSSTSFRMTEPNTTYMVLAANGTPVAQWQPNNVIEWGTPFSSASTYYTWSNSSSKGFMILFRTNSLASSSKYAQLYLAGGHGTSASSTEKLLKVVSD